MIPSKRGCERCMLSCPVVALSSIIYLFSQFMIYRYCKQGNRAAIWWWFSHPPVYIIAILSNRCQQCFPNNCCNIVICYLNIIIFFVCMATIDYVKCYQLTFRIFFPKENYYSCIRYLSVILVFSSYSIFIKHLYTNFVSRIVFILQKSLLIFWPQISSHLAKNISIYFQKYHLFITLKHKLNLSGWHGML